MELTAQITSLNRAIFNQPLVKSDAVVWLQGDRFDRGPKTLEIYKRDLAGKVVISGNNLPVVNKGAEKSIRPDEANIPLTRMQSWLIARNVEPTDIIIDSKSFNTHDQAINVIKLAKKKKWKKIIVVGSWPYYQFRVYLTFLKAAKDLKWNGEVLNQFVVLKPANKPGGRKQTIRQLQKLEQAKLLKYKNHLVSPIEGLSLLKK